MATVTGVTLERVQQIEAKTIVSARVDPNTGILYFKKGDNVTEFDVGKIPRPIDAWPINSIFMNTSASNPKDILGGGTWVRWGQGRMPVSLSEGEAEFNASEKTGGAKTVALKTSELPSHNHGATGEASVGRRSHPTIEDDINPWGLTINGGFNGRVMIADPSLSYESHTHSTGDAGGGGAHNNLSPYITVYMWKRTA